MTSLCQRFIFEQQDVCGVVVNMRAAIDKALSCHHYPASVEKSLADCLIASVLVASRMKTRGDITLQLHGGGSIKLLVAKCDPQLNVRGVAQYDLAVEQNILAADFSAGNLVISYSPVAVGEVSQSVINLQGESVAVSLEHYFLQSEQIPTALMLDYKTGLGFLLQRMPGKHEADNQEWMRLCQDLANVESISDNFVVTELLQNTFPDRLIRLFDAEDVNFRCACSRARMHTALMTLSQPELTTMFSEKSDIEMECEYCLQNYSFTAAECIK